MSDGLDPFDAEVAAVKQIWVDLDGDGKPDVAIPTGAPPLPPYVPKPDWRSNMDAPGGMPLGGPAPPEFLRSAGMPLGDLAGQYIGPEVGAAVSGIERFGGGVADSVGVRALTGENSTPAQRARGALDLVGTFTPVGNALAAYEGGTGAIDAARQGNWGDAAINAGLGAAGLAGGYYALKGARNLLGRTPPAAVGPAALPGPYPWRTPEVEARLAREGEQYAVAGQMADRYGRPVPLPSRDASVRPSATPLPQLESPDAMTARGPVRVGGYDDPQFDYIGRQTLPDGTPTNVLGKLQSDHERRFIGRPAHDSMHIQAQEAEAARRRDAIYGTRQQINNSPYTNFEQTLDRRAFKTPEAEISGKVAADIEREFNSLRRSSLPQYGPGHGRPTVEMVQQLARRHGMHPEDVVRVLQERGFEFGNRRTVYTGRDPSTGRIEQLDRATVDQMLMPRRGPGLDSPF